TSDGAGTFSAASCTLDATGKCSVNYTPTAGGTGTHKITGSYGGDPKHATSSGSFNEAVATRTSGTSVDCVPPSVPVDGSTTCTATVSDTAGTGASTPRSEERRVGEGRGTLRAARRTLDATGKCSVSYTPTAVGTGTHKITGSYGGDPKHATSSGSFNEAVATRTSGTSVDCVPPSVPVDGSTTCTATVSDTAGTGASTPTGTVSWTSDGAGTFSAASCTLDASGKCTVNYTPTAVGTGTHKITGSYGGDAKHATSTANFDEADGRRATATSGSCTPPSVAVDSSTACTATVTNGSGANIPTGTVSCTNAFPTRRSSDLCTLDASGKCTVNYTPTAVGTGTHKLTGSYGGDAKHATSSGSFDEAVSAARKHRTMTTALCDPAVGGAERKSAVVANGSGANSPNGTVSWTSDGTGTFSAASCTLDATGKCTVNYTPTAVGTGTHKITGSYGGDAKHATSTGSFDEAVSAARKHRTMTTVICDPAVGVVPRPADPDTRCTATVGDLETSKTTPTGVVSFTVSINGGSSTFVDSCDLSQTMTGQASCFVIYGTLTTGVHSITASYEGDGTHESSTSAIPGVFT